MIIKSPIYYMGNKFRLMEFLKQHIPNEINTFIDVFGGSGTMAINFSRTSKKIIYNELDERIYNLFNFLMECNPKWLHNKIMKTSKKNGFYFDGRAWKELSILEKEQFKINYYKFRDWINETGRQNEPFYIFYMMNHSFCKKMNFNSKDEMLTYYGDKFYKKNIIDINLNQSQYYMKKTPYETFNLSFEVLLQQQIDELTSSDYVYLDPPYFGTLAIYNKNWSKDHNKLLLKWIDKLHNKGIPFGLSNIESDFLMKWAKAKGYYIYYPKITYVFGPNDATDIIEVFITNQNFKYEQLSLF